MKLHKPSVWIGPFFVLLLLSTLASSTDKQPPTYQTGTITGWSTQHFSRPVTVGGNVYAAPGHKKFYELKGVGMIYQLDDCGSFTAGQAVDYRVEGKKVYIRKENGKEHKCSIEGVKTDTP
jgi:hypothetical protein